MQETHPFRPLPWRPWTDVLLLLPLADDRPPSCLFPCRLARAGSKNVYWLVGKDNESRTNSLLEREIFALHGTVRNKEQHQPPARMMSSTSGPPATPSLFPGVPPPVGHVDVSDLDPALDECCRRDEEEQRRGSALRTVLRHHDRIAAAERARNLRNLVTLTAGGGSEMGPAGSFQGCRCCYDPHRDGGGDYRALLELRAEQQPRLLPSNDDFGDHDDREPLEAAGKSDLSGSDSDSDAELDAMLEGLDVGGSAGALHSGSGEATSSSSSSAVAWEERRRRELEEALRYRQTALEHGYGAHRPVHPSRVWGIVGLTSSNDNGKSLSNPPSAAVVHLVDPDSRASASLDLFLERLASSAEARGTIFVRTGGRSALLLDPDRTHIFLPRLRVESDLPALVAIRDGTVVAVCPNLQGLADCDLSSSDGGGVIEHNVVEWLDRAGVWRNVPPPPELLCRLRPEEEALLDHLAVSRWETEEMNTGAPAVECYDCGLPECRKAYPHTHVGIETTQQSGLVVPSELSSSASAAVTDAPNGENLES